MVDPVANEAVSQITRAGESAADGGLDGADAADSTDGRSFQEVLDGKRNAADGPDAARAAEAEQPDRAERADLDAVDSARGDSGDRRTKLANFVESISEDKGEIDRMLDRSIQGGALDQKELLEMQALIYSYSKKVELTSKVVEKGTGGLKQMMQMRV